MKRVLLIALSMTFAITPQATAAEYSYWGYWHGSAGKWSMSNEGATFVPADGTVEGWRFVKTAGDEMPSEPRVAPDFESLCANTPAESGKKRVGIVIDYGTVEGTGSDALEVKSACAVVATDADGFAVLTSASTIVSDKGMVSCVDGIPSGTCPAIEAMTTSAPVEEDKGGVSPVAAVVGLGLIGSILLLIRRKRSL